MGEVAGDLECDPLVSRVIYREKGMVVVLTGRS